MPVLETGDGGVVTYDEWGQGPVIALIHGSPANSRAWQRVAERLADRFRVVAPNLPGYGESTRPPSGPSDVSHAAAAIESLAGKVGAPVVLAGHSFGGTVALRVALRGRVAPGALALFEPVAVPVLDAVGDREAFDSARAVFEDYTSSFDRGEPEVVAKMVDYWFGAGAYTRLPAAMREFLIANTGQNVEDVRATFRERYAVQSLRRLAMPVVAVHGTRSPEVMARICRAIASNAGQGSLVPLDGATHAMTTTHVEQVADLIAELAARVTPPRG